MPSLNCFSDIGQRLAGTSGIQELMDDLGQALTTHPDMRMLGGGQPAAIPAVQAIWRERMQAIVNDPATLDKTLLNYDPPGGNPQFRENFAAFLRRECQWDVQSENIGILPSSQTAFFLLFNLLAGQTGDRKKRILFPLMPEYIGYASQGLCSGMFSGNPATIELLRDHEFKYHVDFDRLHITRDVAALGVSCPTNPTGNVLTQQEFHRLRDLARQHHIPLIVDNAYGHPFPGVIHTSFQPSWEPGMIFSISLSKLGLPGTRTSIIVADPSIIRALSNMNASTALSNGNLGQAIINPLLADDTLIRVSRDIILPFYQQRSNFATQILHQCLGDKIEWSMHSREGAFFLWLWFRKLKITSAELYQRLKNRNVLVIPGHYFFFGLDEPWEHSQQCIRLTFSQPEAILREAIEIIADELISLH
jgi:valine--pyruvate aminotransferase